MHLQVDAPLNKTQIREEVERLLKRLQSQEVSPVGLSPEDSPAWIMWIQDLPPELAHEALTSIDVHLGILVEHGTTYSALKPSKRAELKRSGQLRTVKTPALLIHTRKNLDIEVLVQEHSVLSHLSGRTDAHYQTIDADTFAEKVANEFFVEDDLPPKFIWRLFCTAMLNGHTTVIQGFQVTVDEGTIRLTLRPDLYGFQEPHRFEQVIHRKGAK